jgi:hypothetical protein
MKITNPVLLEAIKSAPFRGFLPGDVPAELVAEVMHEPLFKRDALDTFMVDMALGRAHRLRELIALEEAHAEPNAEILAFLTAESRIASQMLKYLDHDHPQTLIYVLKWLLASNELTRQVRQEQDARAGA